MEIPQSPKLKVKSRGDNYQSERRELRIDECSLIEENNNDNPNSHINQSNISNPNEISNNTLGSNSICSYQKHKIDSMINIIKTIRQEHLRNEEHNKHVKEAKKKILKIAKLLRTKNLFLKALRNDKDENEGCLLIMHPDLSNFRLLMDSLIIAVILYDSFNAPYKFLVDENIFPIAKEIVIDCILTFDIVLTFFTAYFLNHVLITDFKSIFLNYVKFNFFVDILYVLPFWTFENSLYCMRMIKLYKFFKILKRIRYLLVKLFSYCIKSLKLIHSITNILIFSISLIYILHYMACIFVYIGSLSNEGWYKIGMAQYLLNTIQSKTDIYIASLYLLMETFTTIGYGDINPKTTTEVIFLMICEVVNVGLFAYLISCIMDIILRMSTDEISFKIKTDVDINSWLLKYNYKVPDDSKNTMEEKDQNLFEDVKKYFHLFYKNDYLWVKNFDFLNQMRPDIRKELLNHSFNSLFTTFSFFFNQLEDNFKFKIALNLKSKMYECGDEIISENPDSRKNKIKYIYLIGKGCVQIKKNDRPICRFDAGSYFGDEYFLTDSAKYTYSNVTDLNKIMYLFCCPIKIINEICFYYEESYVMMLIKTLYRFSRIRELGEKNGIIINDTNSKFFKKLVKPIQTKEKKSVTKIFDINELKFNNNDIIYENLDDRQSEMQNIELEYKKEPIKDHVDITEDMKSINNQIFSMDESSKVEKNIENISIQGIHLDEVDVLKEKNVIKIEKEVEEDILDNLEFLDKIELNEENIEGMMKLKNRAEKLQEHNEYLTKLVKKLNFINHQVDFLIDHFKTIEQKSDDMIQIFDTNDTKFFN